MGNPWFRLYHEFATDPKVQMLSEVLQRRFIMLLCLRCCNGDETLQDAEVAFQLRISVDEYAETKAALMAKKLIDKDNKPLAWSKRQFDSDSSTPRVKAYRNRKKAERNGDETFQKQAGSGEETKSNVIDTEADTEADTDLKEGAHAPSRPWPKLSSLNEIDFSAWPSLPTEETMRQWLKVRKNKRATNSQIAMDAVRDELLLAAAQGCDAEECIRFAVARSWSGFKVGWVANEQFREGEERMAIVEKLTRGQANGSRQHNPNQRSSRPSITERAQAAADAVFGTDAGEVLEGDFALVDQHAPAH